MRKTKNIKISEEHHRVLKEYCDEHGFKLFKFIEKLIDDNCKPDIDIYGE